MFIKYGIEEHLLNLKNKGEMYFCPCQQYREYEEKHKQKGLGDKYDGGLHSKAEKAWLRSLNNGVSIALNNVDVSVITAPASNTPAFCLRRTNSIYISSAYREILRTQFSEYTHALIIKDESRFLEQVRYKFRSKAFVHDVFYQDKLYIEFFKFLKNGSSEIRFYQPKAKRGYYLKTYLELNNEEKDTLVIDDSNYFRTMFRKDIFFANQKEFRIVLPYEKIDKGTIYSIDEIDSYLVKIDDLVDSKLEEA